MKLKIAFEIQKSECASENNSIKLQINEEIEKEFAKFNKNQPAENLKFTKDFQNCLNKSTNFLEFKSKKIN